MPAITIELDDQTYAGLVAVAAQQAASVEDVAVRALAGKVRDADDTRAMARRHCEQYKQMFDRLQE